MSDGAPLAGVGRTALGIAAIRARESRRTDRLFDDPYAQAFLGAVPSWVPASRAAGDHRVGAAIAWHAGIRTRFFDDYLIEACRDGCRQAVLLAAGLDTRAFRLDWPPGTAVFEVDLPDVLDFKRRVLDGVGARARCDRTALPADLREDWPRELTAHGFARGVVTAWLMEGLLVYLSAEEADRLLTAVTALSAPGSRLAFEHGGIAADPALREARSLPAMRGYTSLWKGGPGPATPDRLTALGWRVLLHDAGELARSYGRPAPAGSRGGFLTATLA